MINKAKFKRVHKHALDGDTDMDAMARITTSDAP
jgi:hypothetical protein